MLSTVNVLISDPFGVANDASMPQLKLALDHSRMQSLLNQHLALGGEIELREIVVRRHKPGRRCLLEYKVWIGAAETRGCERVLIAKTQAQAWRRPGPQLLRALTEDGFDIDSADGISVPPLIGLIPEARLWLQAKVPGISASTLLLEPNALAHAARIAQAIWKLHEADVLTAVEHTPADELRFLHECFEQLSLARPEWSQRLARVLAHCAELSTSLSAHSTAAIHRDFHPDQVLIDKQRLYLLDFDCYCRGQRALDIGNFVAHITEQSLRLRGSPRALMHCEAAFIARYLELSEATTRRDIDIYAALALARQVQLCTQNPDRHAFAEQLLQLTEERLEQLCYPMQRSGVAA